MQADEFQLFHQLLECCTFWKNTSWALLLILAALSDCKRWGSISPWGSAPGAAALKFPNSVSSDYSWPCTRFAGGLSQTVGADHPTCTLLALQPGIVWRCFTIMSWRTLQILLNALRTKQHNTHTHSHTVNKSVSIQCKTEQTCHIIFVHSLDSGSESRSSGKKGH